MHCSVTPGGWTPETALRCCVAHGCLCMCHLAAARKQPPLAASTCRYQMMPYAFETNTPPIFAAPGGAEAVAYGYVRAQVNATFMRFEVRSVVCCCRAWQAAKLCWCPLSPSCTAQPPDRCSVGRKRSDGNLRAPLLQAVRASNGNLLDSLVLTKPAGWRPASPADRFKLRRMLPQGVVSVGTSLAPLEELLSLGSIKYLISNVGYIIEAVRGRCRWPWPAGLQG